MTDRTGTWTCVFDATLNIGNCERVGGGGSFQWTDTPDAGGDAAATSSDGGPG